MDEIRTLADDLIAAKALIADPVNWRKDANSDAASCCAIVATNRALREYEPSEYVRNTAAWCALYEALPDDAKSRKFSGFGYAVGDFNDHPSTTHADIMALFDRAIASALSKASQP